MTLSNNQHLNLFQKINIQDLQISEVQKECMIDKSLNFIKNQQKIIQFKKALADQIVNYSSEVLNQSSFRAQKDSNQDRIFIFRGQDNDYRQNGLNNEDCVENIRRLSSNFVKIKMKNDYCHSIKQIKKEQIFSNRKTTNFKKSSYLKNTTFQKQQLLKNSTRSKIIPLKESCLKQAEDHLIKIMRIKKIEQCKQNQKKVNFLEQSKQDLWAQQKQRKKFLMLMANRKIAYSSNCKTLTLQSQKVLKKIKNRLVLRTQNDINLKKQNKVSEQIIDFKIDKKQVQFKEGFQILNQKLFQSSPQCQYKIVC